MKVSEFVRALEEVLYHACQLCDLELYVELGYVASRDVWSPRHESLYTI